MAMKTEEFKEQVRYVISEKIAELKADIVERRKSCIGGTVARTMYLADLAHLLDQLNHVRMPGDSVAVPLDGQSTDIHVAPPDGWRWMTVKKDEVTGPRCHILRAYTNADNSVTLVWDFFHHACPSKDTRVIVPDPDYIPAETRDKVIEDLLERAERKGLPGDFTKGGFRNYMKDLLKDIY